MIEADGDKRWGGVFEGDKDDGLISSIPSSQKPKLLKKFDTWDDSNSNFLSSNPHVVDYSAAYFTTALKVKIFVNISLSSLLHGVKARKKYIGDVMESNFKVINASIRNCFL